MISEPPIHCALGAWRNRTAESAMENALQACEGLWGALSTAQVQICPQNRGHLNLERASALRDRYPGTQFRLHATVQADGWSPKADAANAPRFTGYLRTLQALSNCLHAPAYTWHAGSRKDATLDQVLDATRRLTDQWGIPVGIEGLYPSRSGHLVDCWEEYRLVLDSGVHYALDLSHLAIVAHHSGRSDDHLVSELLASPQCLEVHVSGNDGVHDLHRQVTREDDLNPSWIRLLRASTTRATVFSEGAQ